MGSKCKSVMALLALILVACGCSGATATMEPTEIVFTYYGTPEETAYYQELADDFNQRYPHISVDLRPITSGAFDLEEADVLVASLDSLTRLQREGHLLGLTSLIDQDETFDSEDYYPDVVDAFTTEGETWGIPAWVFMDVLYYNKDLFDVCSVPYPEIGWMREDFSNAAFAISDPDAYTFGFVSMDSLYESILFIYQHGGRIFDDVQHPTRTTFDDPLTIEAMAWYADLIHVHNVIPTRMQILDQAFGGTEEGGIYLNKVGMWVGPLYQRGGVNSQQWPTAWKFRWGVAPLPSDAMTVTPIFLDGYAISAQTSHPDACWKWITFLSEQMAQQGAVPARRSLVESDAYEQLVGAEVATVVRASLRDAMLIPDIPDEFEQDLGLLVEAIQQIISGDATAYEALTSAQQQAEQ